MLSSLYLYMIELTVYSISIDMHAIFLLNIYFGSLLTFLFSCGNKRLALSPLWSVSRVCFINDDNISECIFRIVSFQGYLNLKPL